jgi:integrase/recombinase XerD
MHALDSRPEELPPPTVEDAVELYLDSVSASRAASTRATYDAGCRRFCAYLTAAGLPPAHIRTDELPRDVLETFYSHLVKRYGRQTQTARTLVAAARGFLRYCFAQEIGPTTTTYEAMMLRLSDQLGRQPYRSPRVDTGIPLIVLAADAAPLPEEPEARRIVLRDRAILRTLFCTGMRRAEVVSLDRADVRDGHDAEALVAGKGDRERLVFFDQPTLTAIGRYLEARDDRWCPLFIQHNRGRGRPGPGGTRLRLSPQSVWLVVKKYAALAGVESSPHRFRHTKASTLLERGADLSMVQDILGHASPETTKRIYAHYSRQKLRQAFDQFSVTPEALERGRGA